MRASCPPTRRRTGCHRVRDEAVSSRQGKGLPAVEGLGGRLTEEGQEVAPAERSPGLARGCREGGGEEMGGDLDRFVWGGKLLVSQEDQLLLHGLFNLLGRTLVQCPLDRLQQLFPDLGVGGRLEKEDERGRELLLDEETSELVDSSVGLSRSPPGVKARGAGSEGGSSLDAGGRSGQEPEPDRAAGIPFAEIPEAGDGLQDLRAAEGHGTGDVFDLVGGREGVAEDVEVLGGFEGEEVVVLEADPGLDAAPDLIAEAADRVGGLSRGVAFEEGQVRGGWVHEGAGCPGALGSLDL